MKQKKLEWMLQELESFERPKVELEQYATSAELAVSVVDYIADTVGDLTDKTVLDLGSGCGMLIIATIVAHEPLYCWGVELDDDAIEICRRNLTECEVEHCCDIVQADVLNAAHIFGDKKFDVVVSNPPFGTKQNSGIHIKFLEVGLSLLKPGGHMFSLHKRSTRQCILRTAKKWSETQVAECAAELRWDLPATYKFHKQKSVDIEVDLIHVVKKSVLP